MSVSIERTNQRLINRRFSLDALARKLVFILLGQLREGCLEIEECGSKYRFGEHESGSELYVRVHILDPSAYRKILLNGTVGVAEAYMQGNWKTPDLLSVIQLFARNQQTLSAMQNRWTRLGSGFLRLLHLLNRNSHAGSRRNISAHYDLSNDFFALMLDPSMMYSSAIYPSPHASLHDASINKLEHICQRLDLQPDDHLLEIGTGWGSMAIHAAQNYGCRVTTTTISKEQYDFARAAVKKAGLEDRIEVLFSDYRDLEGRFDKLVSVEMIEAVGHRFYPQFFKGCSQLLKPDGLMLLQSITIADQRYQQYQKSADFIQLYIFPGGELPSVQVIADQFATHSDMQIVGLEDITPHYAQTLADWRKNFRANISRVRELGFDSVFERMWEYYLCYCEGGFRERMISTVQILAAKPECRQLPLIKQ